MTYAKTDKILHCPDDASGGVSYFIDPRIAGRKLESLASPATTAMVIEGTPQKTAFRHSGRAMLGYADGHAKVVTPAQMAAARKTRFVEPTRRTNGR